MVDTVGAVSAATSAATTEGSKADKARRTLGANFDDFMLMLTTQLKNQDPTSPLDSNQFTQQLVMFSQVEQAIASNKNLETLIGLNKSNSGMVGYIGKDVESESNIGVLQNGEARFAYELQGAASEVTVSITDPKGYVVYTTSGDKSLGKHEFNWDGVGIGNTQFSDGEYRIQVIATAQDGTAVPTKTYSMGRVTAVNLTGQEPTLSLGPVTVPASKVIAIHEVTEAVNGNQTTNQAA